MNAGPYIVVANSEREVTLRSQIDGTTVIVRPPDGLSCEAWSATVERVLDRLNNAEQLDPRVRCAVERIIGRAGHAKIPVGATIEQRLEQLEADLADALLLVGVIQAGGSETEGTEAPRHQGTEGGAA